MTVGHLCPRKGVQSVLEIFKSLLEREENARYVVVGGDGLEARFSRHLRKMTCDLGLESVVTFTGGLDPRGVATWLRACDVFVLPTENEGCCNALLEAKACNVPVVCSDVGGNREIVSGPADRLIRVRDRDGLLRAVADVLSRSDRDGRIGSSETEVRTWEQVGKETLDSLQKAASEGMRAAEAVGEASARLCSGPTAASIPSGLGR